MRSIFLALLLCCLCAPAYGLTMKPKNIVCGPHGCGPAKVSAAAPERERMTFRERLRARFQAMRARLRG